MGDRVVLHVAPHPDDEAIGCGATLTTLRRAGWEVVNLTCSLGRPGDEVRRRRELDASLAGLGFTGRVATPPVAIGRTDDLLDAERRLTTEIAGALRDVRPAVIASPQVHDGHHGHEVVARAVAAALRQAPDPPVWWMWGLWAELPLPTLYVPFGADVMQVVISATAAHHGERERNDYAALVEARARAAAITGSERVFGFGSPRADPAPFAELLTEVSLVGGTWRLGPARVLVPARSVVDPGSEDVGWWVDSPSPATRRRAGGSD